MSLGEILFYIQLPIVSGIVGWGTNVVAVKMMFWPIEPLGWPPWFGWVGIVPSNAERLARVGLELITRDLLKVQDLFAGRSPEHFLKPSEARMAEMTRTMVSEQAGARFPAMWSMLPDSARESVLGIAVDEVRSLSVRVIDRVIREMDQLLKTTEVVVNAVRADKGLMNVMFLQVGSKEFRFIEVSGLWFGLLFGLVQMLVYYYYSAEWTLPAFGFAVGYATNWLALYLIFEPKHPKKFLGATVQGLFHRRQAEVAHEFGEVVSRRVFTNENLFRQLSRPEARARILEIVDEEARGALDKWKTHPLASGVVTAEIEGEIRSEVMVTVEKELFAPEGVIATLTAQSDDIRILLQERMKKMDAVAFESVLRPAFQQDEWKLIVTGGVLGLLVGWAQIYFSRLF